MGFMAGFGPAFAEGIQKNTDLREQRKDDAFKMVFADYEKNADQRREDKKKDQLNIRKAKAIAQAKDPAVWPQVYNWLNDGLDDAEIEKRMGGTFSVGGTPRGSTPRPAQPGSVQANSSAVGALGTSAAKPSSVSSSEDSGVQAPSAPQVAEAPASPEAAQTRKALPIRNVAAAEDEQIGASPVPIDHSQNSAFLSGKSGKFSGGNFLRNAFGNGSGAESRQQALSEGKTAVAQTLGKSTEEVNQAFEPYTPPTVDASGVSWKPAPEEIKPDAINSLPEAALEVDAAKRSGDPQRVDIATQRYKTLQHEADMQTERDASKQGIRLPGDVYNIFDQSGKRVDAGRLIPGADGTMTLRGQPLPEGTTYAPVLKAEREDMEKIAAEVDQPLDKVRTKKTALNNFVRNYAGMDDLLEKYGDDLLQPWTTQAAQIGQAVNAELQAAKNLTDSIWGDTKQAASENKEWYDPNKLTALEAQADKLQGLVGVGTDSDRLATARQLWETRQVIASYQLGSIMGQDGKSLQEAERKVFTEVAGGGHTAAKWRKGMGDFLNEQVDNISAEEQSVFDNSPSLRKFASPQSWGYVPDAFVAIPLRAELDNNEKSASDTNVEASGDKTLATGWKKIKEASAQPVDSPIDIAKRNRGIPTEEPQAAPQGGGEIPTFSSPQEAAEYSKKVGPGKPFKTSDGRTKYTIKVPEGNQ